MPNEEIKKLFIGGINEEIDCDEINKYFSKFGKIDEIIIQKHKNGKSFLFKFYKNNFLGKWRGFGFLIMSQDVADKILEVGVHIIKDKKIRVQLAIPKEAPPPLLEQQQQQQQQYQSR